MTESKDIKLYLASNSEFRKNMAIVIQNISDLIVYNKKIKNNEPIPADLSKRILNFNTQAIFEHTLSQEVQVPFQCANEELIQQTYHRFSSYDYPSPYKFDSFQKLNNTIDLSYLIRATYEYMLNIDKSEIERKLQYYEKSYLFITTLVENHYKLKSQKMFTHYQRAALATFIVLEIKLVIPPKTKPAGGFTNADLVEISKNALKPVLKRF